MTTPEFHTHYEGVEGLLKAYALKLTANTVDAKDLVQETAAKAFASKNKFEPGTNFKAWIMTIMRYSFLGEARKSSTRARLERLHRDDLMPESRGVVVNDALSSITVKELHDMLHALSLELYEPFDLYSRGFAYREIAVQLGLPIGTVKSRIHFARKKLMNLLRSNYEKEYVWRLSRHERRNQCA